MNVAFTRRARDDLDRRFAYSVEHFGQCVAERKFARLDAFIHRTLALRPGTGQRHPDKGFYESCVPRTPFFLIYRFDQDADILTVLAIFHHAQDRSDFDPPE